MRPWYSAPSLTLHPHSTSRCGAPCAQCFAEGEALLRAQLEAAYRESEDRLAKARQAGQQALTNHLTVQEHDLRAEFQLEREQMLAAHRVRPEGARRSDAVPGGGGDGGLCVRGVRGERGQLRPLGITAATGMHEFCTPTHGDSDWWRSRALERAGLVGRGLVRREYEGFHSVQHTNK